MQRVEFSGRRVYASNIEKTTNGLILIVLGVCWRELPAGNDRVIGGDIFE